MIAISQPTYLPWIGYFGLIMNSDIFIFLDDVQFDKRSWQQRNKVKSNLGEQFISVPVKTKKKSRQLIKDVEINNQNFYQEHLKIIKFNYSKSKYFDKIFPYFSDIEKKISNEVHLSKINIILINQIFKILNLKKKIYQSSDLNIGDKKTSKLINICNHFKDKNYLINPGALDYLKNDFDLLNNENIELYLLEYNEIKYNQLYGNFLSHLSIIDLLFNEGDNSINILNKSFNLNRIDLS
tara:strand:+ start:371 stop:1087 length:717 start_codon:yes stop_codon:yes gene_type:complete